MSDTALNYTKYANNSKTNLDIVIKNEWKSSDFVDPFRLFTEEFS